MDETAAEQKKEEQGFWQSWGPLILWVAFFSFFPEPVATRSGFSLFTSRLIVLAVYLATCYPIFFRGEPNQWSKTRKAFTIGSYTVLSLLFMLIMAAFTLFLEFLFRAF